MRDYRFSYSGADATAFVWYEGVEQKIVKLESLHTISMSVHEAKGQVRTLGYRGIRGLTRSVRTIAGSMIFIVIDDHPLRQMMALAHESPLDARLGWSLDRDQVGVGKALKNFDFTNRLGTLLPPLNFLLTYVHEVAHSVDASVITSSQDGGPQVDVPGAALLLKGVEFLDEGLVTSVNDIVSEITYSFIARDYKELSMMQDTFDADAEALALVRQREDAAQQEKQNELWKRLHPGWDAAWAGGNPTSTVVDENGQPIDMTELSAGQLDMLRMTGAGSFGTA